MIPGPKLDFKSDFRVSYLMIIHQRMLFVRSLCQSELPFDERVHEIRKTVKKLRAEIRLMRSRYKEKACQWDERLQNVNLALSNVRDAAVFLYAYRCYFKNSFRHNGINLELTIESFLENERDKVLNEQVFENIAGEMMSMIDSIKFDSIKEITLDDLLIGTVLTYKKAKKRFRELLSDTDNPMIHPFRKSMKKLEYQADIFPVSEDSSLSLWLADVDELTDLLGSYNDLDAFCSWINENKLIEDKRICGFAGKKMQDIYADIIEHGGKVTGWKIGKFDKILREELEIVFD